MSATQHYPVFGENLLLAALSPAAVSLLRRHLHSSNFEEGVLLWDDGEIPQRVYFPRSGMISVRVPAGNGSAIEVASVGREGAAGLQYNRGGGAPSGAITRAVVQVGGQFAFIAQNIVAAVSREHDELGRLFGCGNHWLLLQAQQIAVCNSVHSAEARFCRWLLRASDTVPDETVHATQEAIAEALGVRRTTATMIAQRLQQVRIINYSRGKIVIRDRARLEAVACDCHTILGRRNWPSEFMRIDAAPATAVTLRPSRSSDRDA